MRGQVKRRRFRVRLTDEQQLILALLLVVLLAVSMLYCLGFASLVLRQTLENTPIPSNGTILPAEDLEATPSSLPVVGTPQSPTSP